MSETRYRAYLSYSHQDHAWADWLHKALESFRIPGRLRSTTDHELPPSLAPVFRDRDDLASAADLGEHLKDALRQSEALIVICSPAAAASEWVNEEIRTFRRLHGDASVHCVIVDGDPQSPAGDGGCFPPALLEGKGGEAREPLAADPRTYADGKRLALLKVVSGLLGVRLDALRRRDLARRRRGQLALAAALLVAVVLVGTTWNARVNERQERAQAEQMAAFIVDLGEELRGEINLDSLGRISDTAMGYLEQLDEAQLTPETRMKVGRALRQVGNVNWDQGALDEARDAFDRSLEIYQSLNEAYPDNDDVWFELSQAEFYSGYIRADLNQFDDTLRHFHRYRDIAEQRHAALPDDRRWLLELSYAQSNLVNMGLELGQPVDEQVLQAIRENIALAGRALEAWERAPDVMAHYLNELAFAADAQLSVCNLEEAQRNRLASLIMNEQLLGVPGLGVNQQVEVARREYGLAAVLVATGDLAAAREHLSSAVTRLERELQRDPSNETLADDLSFGHQSLAEVEMHSGDYEASAQGLARARALREPLMGREVVSRRVQRGYVDLVLMEIRHARLSGNGERARALLARERELLTSKEIGSLLQLDQAGVLVRYRHEHWRLTGLDPAYENAALAAELPPEQGEFQSCSGADSLARHHFMTGEMDEASIYSAYLADAGYRDPDYLDFCRTQGLCPE